MIRLFHQEALEFLQAKPKGYRTIWMDIPDNIGVDYGEPDDNRPDYFDWLQSLITLGMRTGACSIWISYNSKHDVELKYRLFKILRARSHWTCRTIMWRYTFGQYLKKDHAYGYRPIVRLNIKGYPWKFDGIRVQSKRMELGDPRAAGPKIPDDVWDFVDSWEFPRVTGNSKERKRWAPNQHPVLLVERIFKMSGDPVLELFTGSGSAIQAARNLGIKLDTVELDSGRVEQLEAAYSLERQ
jgi:DNA modification methylase